MGHDPQAPQRRKLPLTATSIPSSCLSCLHSLVRATADCGPNSNVQTRGRQKRKYENGNDKERNKRQTQKQLTSQVPTWAHKAHEFWFSTRTAVYELCPGSSSPILAVPSPSAPSPSAPTPSAPTSAPNPSSVANAAPLLKVISAFSGLIREKKTLAGRKLLKS